MGLFTGYCKKCKRHISWFIHDGGGITCEHCSEFNTDSDLWDSEFWSRHEDLKLMMDRVTKIIKIKNRK